MPGQPGFTGVPPRGERRFVGNEMVLQVRSDVSRQTLDGIARNHGFTIVGSHNFRLAGQTIVRVRITNGRPVADVIRALEAQNVPAVAQPNYVYRLQQDTRVTGRGASARACHRQQRADRDDRLRS